MKVFMAKYLHSLHPADDDAEALVQKLGQGELVEVEV